MAHYFELVQGSDVVQILHRGGEIKVLMTQGHYLDLLSRLALYERSPNAKTVPAKSAREIESALALKLKRHSEEEFLRDDSGPMGRKRAR